MDLIRKNGPPSREEVNEQKLLSDQEELRCKTLIDALTTTLNGLNPIPIDNTAEIARLKVRGHTIGVTRWAGVLLWGVDLVDTVLVDSVLALFILTVGHRVLCGHCSF